jgi:uncharacterized protein
LFKLPSLFPRDDKFNRLLEQLTVQAGAAAQALKKFVDSPEGPERQRASEEISACKARAKEASASITSELCRSFITPFDREDIQDLANIMYKIPKIIEKVKERIIQHNIAVEHDFTRQADLILLEAQAAEKMIQALLKNRGDKQVVESAALLDDLENRGDTIRNELFTALFTSKRDAKDIILRRDIYDMLEKVVDRFRDAAGVSLQIVLKHS